MLPYVEHPVWHAGPLTIHAFGVAVAIAMWIGFAMARRQFDRAGLDIVVGQRLGAWMVGGGILGAHLFSVLLYFPAKLRSDPWLLVRVWEDISSFGGIIGGIIAAIVFFAFRMRGLSWHTRLSYLDAVAFVFPAALAVGRAGCALAHDHPGAITSFPLALSLESESARAYIRSVYSDAGLVAPTDLAHLGFHDLGLYEFLFLALLVVPIFALWNRRQRPAGFYLFAFALLYLPVRFAFDMLRVSDVRYIGLTPAQWAAAIVLAVLPFVVSRRKAWFGITGIVILGTAWACRGGDARAPDRSNGTSVADTVALSAPARTFLSTLDARQRAVASFRFDDAERTSWAYVPQRRAGLPLRDMNDEQSAAAFGLVSTGLSERGTMLARGVIELEGTLRELEGWTSRLLLRRNPELYYMSLFVGSGAAQPWGWRFEGHHLSVNVTELGAHGKVVAPLFVGANPSRVPSGPKQGHRLLAAEEDLGRALIDMLDTLQRSRAIIAAQTFGDVVTGSDPAVQSMAFAGLPASEMTVDQKAQLRRLLELYASRMADSSAAIQMRRIEEVGFERLHFAWAGATQPGEGHYYRIHGPTMLIEFDNSFGNHIHTVWRDLENDFGGDLLRKHYARHAHGK